MQRPIIASQHSSLIFLLFLALFFCSCGRSPISTHTPSVLHRGLSGEPSTLDPAGASDNFSQEVIRDLYEGLTAESPTGEVTAGVAAFWETDASGTEYTFHLRADARWSNGQPVRAQDFVFAWQRVVDPKRASPLADDLRPIAGAVDVIDGVLPVTRLGVTASDDRTLIVRLTQPAPFLPQLLTHTALFPIYSEASANSHATNSWVSNGPYVLSAWSNGASLTLEKNQMYWDRKNVRIPGVEFQIISDDNAQLARYRAGQLDITDTIPANALPSLRREHPREIVISPFLATAYYGLNLSSRAFKNDIKLRQALAMVIDRKRLTASLGFEQIGAYGFVPPGTWNYTPQSWPWEGSSATDLVAAAKKLYAESGYSRVAPLRLRVLYHSNPVIRNTAIIIASMWKDALGVETEMIEEEYRVFLRSRQDKSRWDAARLGWTADYNDAANFLDIFRSKSPNNDLGYSNPLYDTLAEDAAKTADPIRRRSILEKSEQLMLSDYPVIPLYFFVSKRLVREYVKGVHPNPLNHVDSKELAIVHD